MDRKNKSDNGIVLLGMDTLSHLFGLSDPLIERIIKLIRERGEYDAMKDRVRNLSGQTHKRLLLAIDAAEVDSLKDAGESTEGDENATVDVKEGNAPLTLMQLLELSDGKSTSTDLKGMDSDKLKRLSTMDPERRGQAVDKLRRAERLKEKNPRLRQLRAQKERIQQQINVEMAKNKT